MEVDSKKHLLTSKFDYSPPNFFLTIDVNEKGYLDVIDLG